MCVRRFDDSLNSAIHNTLSRFATVFIDTRAKGSTVGSCMTKKKTIMKTIFAKDQPTHVTRDKQKKTPRVPLGHETLERGWNPFLPALSQETHGQKKAREPQVRKSTQQ